MNEEKLCEVAHKAVETQHFINTYKLKDIGHICLKIKLNFFTNTDDNKSLHTLVKHDQIEFIKTRIISESFVDDLTACN